MLSKSFVICKPDENLWEQNLSHQKKKKRKKERKSVSFMSNSWGEFDSLVYSSLK